MILVFSLIGCDDQRGSSNRTTDLSPLGPAPWCTEVELEAPIEASEPSSLGFSAEDVLASLALDTEVEAADAEDGTTTVRELALAFAPAGQVWVEHRTPWVDECIGGDTLVIPVTTSVGSPGWFDGVEDGEIEAQALTPDSIWVSASFEVAPSDELLAVAVARFATHVDAECTTPRIDFIQAREPDRPWSFGPVGGLSVTCGYGAGMEASLTLYSWGPE